MVNIKLKAQIVEQFLSQIDFAEVVEVNEILISKGIRSYKHLSETERSRRVTALECKTEDIFRD
jgi:hypothetical protein